MHARKKVAPKAPKSFEESQAELIKEGKGNYADMVDWSRATWMTRQGCPKHDRWGAHQNGVTDFVLTNGSMSTNTMSADKIR